MTDYRNNINRRGAMRKNNEQERLLNVNEAAALLGVSTATVYGWVHERRIPHYKPTKRCLRFRQSELEDWLRKAHVEDMMRR
ncbi:MAG: helix-turn-helix domain-containing protein [Candidatus Poribacteria bacterium]|nr:helix-turn-helix domain-containing protein [Candidatus Poribacteria bacterium]